MQTIKQIILDYIKRRGHVSYAELSRDIDGFKGDYECWLKHNLFLWSGLSLEADIALNELVKEGSITMRSASFMVYLIDGLTLKLPIAKRVQDYKKPHWLPVTFSTK